MAKQETVPAKPTAPASKTFAFGRAMLPYVAAVVVASCAMAWYFFVFVPSHLHYFVGARFRTLAVAAGQISSKIDNLQKALDGAATSLKKKDSSEFDAKALTSYLKILVPDMQPLEQAAPAPKGLTLSVGDKYAVSVAWRDVVDRAAVASLRDFDDLLLANDQGDVVWQREDATPRVANLGELLNAETPTAGWLPLSLSWAVNTTAPSQKKDPSIPDSAVMKSVNLNGRSSYLLVQAINPPLKKFYVAGLVPTAALQKQAMHIPTARVVLFFVPVCLLFLALPFVKLATLTARERFGFVDAVLLVLAAVMATGIGTILLFVPSFTNSSRDAQLSGFATKIEANLAAETKKILSLAREIQSLRDSGKNEDVLLPCEVKVPEVKKRCGLWQAINAKEAGSLELDVAVWIQPDSMQELKWTTKRHVTGNTSHRTFEHYRDLHAGRTWRLKDKEYKDLYFTIDPLRSPTTSELGFAFALAAERDKSNLMLNVRPQTVVDPIVPPGYGFAILAPSGKVLFHSEEGLSLEENFFQEVNNPEDVRAKAQIDRQFTWSGDYHGRLHRLHMRPVEAFVGNPWRIVTFEELETRYAAEFSRQTGVFRLGCINLLVLTGAGFVFWWRARKTNVELRYTIISMFAVPSEATSPARDRSIAGLTKLAVAGGLVFLMTFTPLARHWNLFYVFFLVLPILAIRSAVRARRTEKESTAARQENSSESFAERKLAMELLLLLLVISVIPAAGFTRIVHRFETFEDTQLWLLRVQQQWFNRAARTHERVTGPGYSPDTSELLTKGGGFAAEWSAQSEGTLPYSYLDKDLVPGVELSGASADKSAATPLPFPDPLRFILRLFGPKDQASGRSSFTVSGDTLTLNPEGGVSSPSFKVPSVGAPGEDVSIPKVLSGTVILLTVFVSLLWASRKLSTSPVARTASLESQLTDVKENEGILVIGPPLNKKDSTLREAVIKDLLKPNSKLDRIPLLDMALNNDVIDSLVEKYAERSPNEEPRGDSKPRLWIHLSNLESQLTTVESRALVLRLLERLMNQTDGQTPRVLVVTSSVDPVANFREIFEKERRNTYENSVPEVELSNSALVLSRFRRCYLPLKHGPGTTERVWQTWQKYHPNEWRSAAEAEILTCPPLHPLLHELKGMWGEKEPIERYRLARTITSKARAYYELLWTSCTRTEKVALIQLAQEGFVNPKSRDVVAQLVAKGLVVENPKPAVFNYTFREFLRGCELKTVVQDWEQMEGTGVWFVSGRLVSAGLILGGVFYLLTQDFSLQTLLPIVSGTGVFGIPIVRDLVARLGGKAGAGAASA